MDTINLPLTIKVFKEGSSKESPFVAYNSEFDISSCGKTEDKARKMLEEAVFLLLKGAREDGTFDQLMQEAGFGNYKEQPSEPKTYFSILNFSFPATSGKKFSYA